MNRISFFLACCASTGIALSVPASANDRYGQRPPVVLSPDLSAPWVMQLGNQRAPQGGQIIYRTKPKQAREAGYQVRQRPAVEPRATHAAAPRAKPSVRPELDPRFLPQTVSYPTSQKPGTIIIDTSAKFLYYVLGDGEAKRYGVGVGKEGHAWNGTERISRKAEWPDWRPPAEMIKRVREKEGRVLPAHMKGGPENPLGARALYLGSTLYRIHGTNQPWTIGQAVSSGCIRMRNEDVLDLYERSTVGSKVIVM